MKTKTITQLFESLGFSITMVPNLGFYFVHMDKTFMVLLNEDYPEYLCITVPNLYYLNPQNQEKVFNAINEVNGLSQYVKLVVKEKCVWAYYPHRLVSEKNVTILIKEMLEDLRNAVYFFHKVIVKNNIH